MQARWWHRNVDSSRGRGDRLRDRPPALGAVCGCFRLIFPALGRFRARAGRVLGRASVAINLFKPVAAREVIDIALKTRTSPRSTISVCLFRRGSWSMPRWSGIATNSISWLG